MPRNSTVFNPLPPEPTDSQLLRLRCDSQSLQYYSDISAFISTRLRGFHQLSLLDVGPRTGAGLAYLRLVHHPAAFTRLKFEPVAGIDLDPMFQNVAATEFPDIVAMTGNIFDLPEKSWDLVTCSHTIEHIEDMECFIKQLETLARKYVVLACPFAENPLSTDHIQSVTYERLKEMGYHDVKVYESQHWHTGLVCLAFKAL